MKIDRRTLAWLALGGSLLLCFPCGLFNGILTAVGTATLMLPDIETGITAAEDTYYAGLLGGLARAAGARDPDALAQELCLLMDGVAVGTQMRRQAQAAECARRAAEVLVERARAANS